MEKISRREKKQLEFTFPFLCWDSETVVFPPHWHDCFEIILVVKGKMYVSIDDMIYEVAAGDIVMINSGAIHGFFDSSPGTTIQGFQFDITFFDEGFINIRDIIFQTSILSKKTGVSGILIRLLTEILNEYNKKHIGYQLAVKSKLYELMLVILREAPKRYHKISSSRYKQILAFVFKNYDDSELTLEQAADALQLNKFYFSRFFKKHTGHSFHSYLTKTRVDFAKRYLIESKISVTDIAFRTGFGSIQTFNRVFKTLTGFAPREYRRENSVTAIGFTSNYQDKFD